MITSDIRLKISSPIKRTQSQILRVEHNQNIPHNAPSKTPNNSNSRIHQNNLQQQTIPDDHYYMGKDSWFVSRLLYLHYFNVLPAYFKQYRNNKFIPYRPEYDPMISNKYLWHKFRSKRGTKFSLLKQLVNAEKAPLITIILVSILIGVLALFSAYFQRFLFAQFYDTHFPTSGWLYFGLITGTVIIKFLLFNFAQTLANSSAINIRCYIENTLIKLLFYLPNNISEGLLINNLFSSVDIIRSSFQIIPYFVSSFIIVFGIVGFIIHIIGKIGWIVLGLTLFMFVIEFFLFRQMLHLHHQYVKVSDKRTSLLLYCTENLLKFTQNGLSKTYLKMMNKQRKQQTKIDQKYNLVDGFIQVLTQSISFISVFVFFVVSEATLRNSGASYPTYKQILDVVILFSVFKTPIKMVAYGVSMGLEGYAALGRLQELFDKCSHIPSINKQQKFYRTYPNPCPFAKKLTVHPIADYKQQYKQIIPQKTCQILTNPKYVGKMIMLLGKINANPDCEKFIEQIEQSIPYHLAYYIIDIQSLIEDKSIRDNILFGEAYNQQKYQQVLQLLDFKQELSQYPQGDLTRMDENYFKSIYFGLQLKIEIARALYCDVQLLIINRLIFKRYEHILLQVKKYMSARNHTTLIVNLSGSHYEIADWLIILDKNNQKQQGTYQQLKSKRSKILLQFQRQYYQNKQMIQKQNQDNTKNNVPSNKSLDQQPIDNIKFKFLDFFKFYNLTHWGAPIVLIIFIIAAPLLDLYMEVIIAESAKIWEHNNQNPLQVYLVQNIANQSIYNILNSSQTPTEPTTNHTTTQEIYLNFDHIITLRYSIAALTFVLINLIKIFLLSLYLRFSAQKIVEKIGDFIQRSRIEKILNGSNRRNALNIERNIENIDTRITADLDVGITIIFQQLTALIFGAVSSILFLAIGIPFFIITLVIILIMITYNRKILTIRRQARSKFNSFIKKLIINRKVYIKLNKIRYVTAQYIAHNKVDIIADLNEEWMMEALGIILEVVFILLLVVTMAVSLVKFHEIEVTNAAFIELAISFLIGMTNGGRTNLKIFQSLDFQLIGITSLFKTIQKHQTQVSHHHQPQVKFIQNLKKNNKNTINSKISQILPKNYKISSIQFIGFHVRFKDDILNNVNLTIREGDRIVVTGSRGGGKRVMVYALMAIFEPKHIQGDILINGNIRIYNNHISRDSLIDKIYVLDAECSQFRNGQTIQQNIQLMLPEISKQEISNKLRELWSALDVEPIFELGTSLDELSSPKAQLLAVVRGLLIKPEIFIIEGGLDHIDCVNRQKLTRWLISNQQISILLDLTNRIQAIKLYKRHIDFTQGKLTQKL